MLIRKSAIMTIALLSCGLMACGSSTSRMPENIKKVAEKPLPPAELPKWAVGEYPTERAFFGHGEAPLDAAGAKDLCRKAGLEMLKMELALLTRGIKIDHEEQVAEVISRYSPEKFNAYVDAAVLETLEKAQLREEHKSVSRNKLYVLYTLPLEAFYEALYAQEGLPEEQKSRVRNYKETFSDAAMLNLSRMEEE